MTFIHMSLCIPVVRLFENKGFTQALKSQTKSSYKNYSFCRYKLCSADAMFCFEFTERVVSIVSHAGNLLFYLAVGCLYIVGAIYGRFEMPESKNKNTIDSPG